jgi:ribose transport system ATP-binding protein
MTLLEMSGISKEFPGVKALENVDFSIERGEVRILIGENGAGKSTLMKILAGVYKPDKGSIVVDGEDVLKESYSPRKAIEAGVATIYQELNLNNYTSIYENIFSGKELTRNGLFINKSEEIQKCKKLLDKVGLDVSPLEKVGNLSIAQMQMIEIAKALAFNAKIIIFDEPTSSLTETETRTLFKIINELKSNGIGIVYISHRLEELFEIGDSCTVLRDGTLIGTEPVSELTVETLIQMMVGRCVDSDDVHSAHYSDDVVLEVQNLSWGEKLHDISFQLKKGECLAFSGLVGSGRTELAKCIIGEYKRDSGEIIMNGKTLNNRSVKESVRNKIVYLSEDRKKDGLFLKHSVCKNISISSLDRLIKGGLISIKKEKETAIKSIKELTVKTPNSKVNAETLSGGNQQKVIIAKWLLTDGEVYIFDEPTRGIDVGAKFEIYNVMEELLENGASIIMISSEMPEVLNMSDRVLVMREGHCEAILENKDLCQEDIFHYAIGANKYNG